ncbi:MAG: DUF2007 domain-containing protein [Planctomycetales bacterium]|nr:DUF2007 domain-containing protein [Planctomycetales bacterium]
MNSDPNNPEVLASLRNELEASPIVAALAACGIMATTTGGFTADFRAEAPGEVRVMVKSQDLARAKTALEEFSQQQSEIDWSQVDVGQPD